MADGGLNDARARRQARQEEIDAGLRTLGKQYAEGGNVNEGAQSMERDVNLVVKGVTINWLAQAFHMDHRSVTSRLKDCPALSRKRGGSGLLYDLSVAAAYLIKPVFDVEKYIKTMKVEELPTHLQDAFWAAALKRQKWEENAGRLWRTEKVSQRFAETFLMVANDMKVWIDDMESVIGITDEQRKHLEKCVVMLQKKISKSILEMPKFVAPQASEITPPVAVSPVQDTDNDIDADIFDVV